MNAYDQIYETNYSPYESYLVTSVTNDGRETSKWVNGDLVHFVVSIMEAEGHGDVSVSGGGECHD
jgi:hypothetical protein